MAEAAPEFVTRGVMTAVGLVITIASAVPTIDKRLARLADIQNELGSLRGPVRWLYIWPQFVYKWGLSILAVAALLAVLAYALPSVDHPVAALLRSNGVLILLLWLGLGMTAYTNLVSWFGIGVMRAASAVAPVRSVLLGGRKVDENPTWSALRTLVNYNESAKAIIVDRRNAQLLADRLLRMAREDPSAAEQNRAGPPDPLPSTNDDKDRVGNALLVACVIEGSHSHLPQPAANRAWRPFYDAAKQLSAKAGTPVSPDRIRAGDQIPALVDTIISDLNAILTLAIQPLIPDSDLLKSDLRACLAHLAEHHEGMATKVDPGRGGLLRSRGERIRSRVEAIPGLSPGMRAQFVKLAILWHVWERVGVAGFRSAGSQRIAATLLNRRIIAVTGETKQFNLSQPREQQLFHIAAAAVVDEAIKMVEQSPAAQKNWLPAAALEGSSTDRAWMTAYEVDYRLFDYSKRLAEGKIDGEAMAPWTVTDGQLARA